MENNGWLVADRPTTNSSQREISISDPRGFLITLPRGSV